MPPVNDTQNETLSSSELVNELKYLGEEQKIIKIMDMLKNIYFGELVIKKHKGKVASFEFRGQVLFRLEEFDKNKRAKP